MTLPKTHNLTIATLRSIITLCIFCLLFGPLVMAQRESKRLSDLETSRAQRKQSSTGKAGRIPFTISGRVGGLYPGAVRPLTLHVDNPHSFRIKVRSLKVRVGSSDHPGCGPEWIRPKRKVKVSVLVPARSRASVGYPVRMLEGAPTGCNGSSWTLRFSGIGSRP